MVKNNNNIEYLKALGDNYILVSNMSPNRLYLCLQSYLLAEELDVSIALFAVYLNNVIRKEFLSIGNCIMWKPCQNILVIKKA